MHNERQPQYSDIIFYTSPEGNIKVEVLFSNDTFWLSQKRMAELFGVEVHTINYHLKEIFKTGELQEISTIRKIRIVQKEGGRDVSRDVDFFNLDAIKLPEKIKTVAWSSCSNFLDSFENKSLT